MSCDIGTAAVAAAGAPAGACARGLGVADAIAFESGSLVGTQRPAVVPACGSQTCLGMIWPVQWKPHSFTLSLSAATLATVSSYTTDTLFEAMLSDARWTPCIHAHRLP